MLQFLIYIFETGADKLYSGFGCLIGHSTEMLLKHLLVSLTEIIHVQMLNYDWKTGKERWHSMQMLVKLKKESCVGRLLSNHGFWCWSSLAGLEVIVTGHGG